MKKGIIILLLLLAVDSETKAKEKDEEKTDSFSWNKSRTAYEYSGWALNTVFNLPMLRYNYNSSKSTPLGTLDYFNSLGAGIGLSFGQFHISSKDGKPISEGEFSDNTETTMKNICGISLGFLFSKSNIDSNTRTIFAPNLNFQLLDFQIGVGYELGDVSNTAHRTFMTLSYGLPLTKLAHAGSYRLGLSKKYKINNTVNRKENRFF